MQPETFVNSKMRKFVVVLWTQPLANGLKNILNFSKILYFSAHIISTDKLLLHRYADVDFSIIISFIYFKVYFKTWLCLFLSLAKTCLFSTLPRDLEDKNPWHYHRFRTTHLPDLLRVCLQKWNILFDFLLFWFGISTKYKQK